MSRSRNRLRGAVGMQGCQHQMPCQRRLDADLGRLNPHFADQIIRVGAKKRPHRRRKIKSDFRLQCTCRKPRW